MPKVVRLTPAEAADKHRRRTIAAIPDMQKGIESVTEAPGVKAAENRSKWIARLQESATQDKWERNVRAVTLADWKKKMIDKGIGRVAAGIEAAQGKVTTFYTQLFDYENGLLATLDTMPDLTLEDSIARMNYWVREMAKFRG